MTTGSFSSLRVGNIELDSSAKSVKIGGRQLAMSPTSFALLSCLMEAAPNVMSVEQILERAWSGKVVNKDAVKQQVKLLRDQLGSHGDVIKSVRGFGYKIHIEPNTNPTLEDNAYQTFGFAWVGYKYIGLAGALLLATAILFFSFSQPRGKLALPLVTAVLPFNYPDQANSDLPILLQDELTSMLSKQDKVRAISTSAIQHAQAQNYSVEDFAEKLNVDMLFEGSIRESDLGLHINIRMVWTNNSIAVWRDNIDIEIKNREVAIRDVRDTLKTFINKKVVYIETKLSPKQE